MPPINHAFPRAGPAATGPWNVLALQFAVDMCRGYEAIYHRYVESYDDNSYGALNTTRYYRRFLELKFLISTYFTDPALQLVARRQVNGLYQLDNHDELLLVLHSRLERIRSWLRTYRGHPYHQEYSVERQHYSAFLRTALRTSYPVVT